MASAPIYCTHKELKRVFPQLDEYDQKTPIYGWTTESISGDTYYVSYDSGLMTQLFIDGKSQQSGNQTIGTAKVDDCAEEFNATDTIMNITSVANFTPDIFIKVDDEIMYVEVVTDDTQDSLTVVRGVLGTTATAHSSGADIFLHFQPSAAGDNLYDADNDFIILKYGSNPADSLVEVGENFASMVTQFRSDASRYLDSRLDPKLPKSQWKNSAGVFDYIIVRTAALIAAAFMIRTNNPTSEVLESIEAEFEKNIELLNTGRASIGFQNTGDASKGVIRDVKYTDGSLRPVDLKGTARSVDFDLIKVEITTGGVLGTSKFDVFIKDSEKLKSNKVRENVIITGDYQVLAYGIQIRFGGDSHLDTATLNNEWEVEVRGVNEETDASDISGIKMTRNRGV